MDVRRAKKPVRSVQIVVRVEPELRDAFVSLADQERRTMSNVIHNALADWIKGRQEVAA